MDLIITILPVVTEDLPISPRFTPYNFFIAMQVQHSYNRQPMVEFYLLTFPRFPLRKKQHKSYFAKNRTHDFRTSRCAAYLLDHSVVQLGIVFSDTRPSGADTTLNLDVKVRALADSTTKVHKLGRLFIPLPCRLNSQRVRRCVGMGPHVEWGPLPKRFPTGVMKNL